MKKLKPKNKEVDAVQWDGTNYIDVLEFIEGKFDHVKFSASGRFEFKTEGSSAVVLNLSNWLIKQNGSLELMTDKEVQAIYDVT